METKAFDILNFHDYAENALKIRTKDSKIVPFAFNTAQLKLDNLIEKLKKEKIPIRIVILKARQLGFSTYTEGKLFHKTVTTPHYKTGIITHKDEATANLFNMSKRYYDYLPDFLKPTILTSNVKEIVFNNKQNTGLDSSFKCMTAGSPGVGRSDTYNGLHLSELAFWEGNVKETYVGLMQSVPNTEDSIVIVESTANGYNFFKDFWDSANKEHSDPSWNGFYPIFFPWYEEPTYRNKYNGFILTKEEIDLKIRFNLDNEQIAWRRYAITQLCGGDINLFHQEYPATPEEAFIATGRTVFPKSKVINRIDDIQKVKYEYALFEYDKSEYEITNINVKFVNEDDSPTFKIFEKPKSLCPYVIGVDTAGEGEDYNVAQVLDNTCGRQVAIMRMKDDEDFFIHQLYCLGLYYNNALIGVETNLSTYHVKKLEELGYDNQYIRIREDTIGGKLTQSYGFRTTTSTKPFIISNYKNMFRETPELFMDKTTLLEMLTFIDFKGKMNAMEGYHDDCVMSMAIALYLFTTDQQEHVYSEKQESTIRQRSIFDDFNNDQDGKEHYLRWD